MVMQKDTIYCGDNLDIMKGFEDGCIDLSYIDPPFFTSQSYEVIWKDGAEKRSFDDRWVKMGEGGRYSKDINVYLNFMEPRIREIYRVLKNTGTFYLHCDWHADGYLRVLCDQIFGYGNFLGVIIWNHPDRSMGNKFFPDKTDTILAYAKSSSYTFNHKDPLLRQPIKDTGRYNKVDEDGRKYALVVKNGKYSKIYFKEEGKLITNCWEFPSLRGNAKESLGYPTQKPEALLERIVAASSNPGDVVLDCFAGCGTAIAVANKMNRNFVGIDISPTACRLIARRIKYPLPDIIGLPLEADDISNLGGYEFQNAMIRLIDPSLDAIKIGIKGADGGFDGSYYDIIISVKKYKAGRKDLDEFVATIYRESSKSTGKKKNRGMFIALGYTADFIKEVARLGREQEIVINFYTVEQIVKGEHQSIITDENQSHGKLI